MIICGSDERSGILDLILLDFMIQKTIFDVL